MPTRVLTRLAAATVVVLFAAAPAPGYIHFPPATLVKMCRISHYIRVLEVTKYDRDTGVIVYKVVKVLKAGDKTIVTSFRHVLRTDATGAKPIREWVAGGKTTVMFSIEGKPGVPGQRLAVGYVFLDGYCYSVDYNIDGKYWLLIRGEPGLSACYHGSVGQLRKLIPEILADKDVKVPVKQPDAGANPEQRRKEVTDVITKQKR